MTRDERRRASRRTAQEAAAGGIDRPPDPDMLADVLHGLGSRQKELSPKYFYDERGAALFDEITRLPVYYLTRTERRLLADTAAPWLRRLGARTLVELGAGSGDKTRLLLDALPAGGTYVPLDISAPYLEQVAAELGADYPHLRMVPVLSDITGQLELPQVLPRPVVVAFLGSTIGNLDDRAARRLLRRVRAVLHAGDRLLLGIDLRKDRATLEAAYNDPQGVTAEFNRNVLRVLNRELGADFDVDVFRHRAFYDERLGRIEMHLVADAEQVVHIGTHAVRIAAGESIRTEISAKYDRPTVRAMLEASGLTLEQWVADDGCYAVVIAAPAAAPAAASGKRRRAAVPAGRFTDEATAAEWLRLHAFPARSAREPRIGAEVELIAHDALTHDVALYDDGRGPLGQLLARHAQRHGWCADHSAKGAPRWLLPNGGAVTLEPGGQVEYSSRPHASVRELLHDLNDTTVPLIRAAAEEGITLLGIGIDPCNDLAHAPLQLDTPRYRAMDEYFGARGVAGQRMMRQTAAVQLNIDPWHDPVLTWRVLRALTPCVLALTANSAVYAGAPTGHASYRAATWRELDPSRTGLCTGTETDDVALAYARFALAAEPMVDDPFGAGWADHLSTLFPEVRPRGWFELRTADAAAPESFARLILPVATVLRDARALHETAELLGTPSMALLERAGRHGLADAELRRLCAELHVIAAAAAARDPAGGQDAEVLEELRLVLANTSSAERGGQRA